MECPDLLSQSLNGMIERVTFHNPENGFCVLRVKAKKVRELITVTGHTACVTAGAFLECSGHWVNNKTYGLQFSAVNIKIIPPSTLEGIEKYLASGLVKGIGAYFAKKLVQSFKDDVFRVIEEEPDRLLQVEGIGKVRKERLTQSWVEQKVVRDIMVFLQSHGVGTARAVRIYKTYGDDAIERVRQNPYCLSNDITGIGFKTADALAQRLGIAKDSPFRAQAGIHHALLELSGQGHCAAEQSSLIELTAKLLEVSTSIIESALQDTLKAGYVVSDTINGHPCVFVKALYLAEVGVAQHLLRLKQGKTAWQTIQANVAIDWVERKTGLALSTSQKSAIALALRSKVMVITGGPGVGKTTLVKSLLRIVQVKAGSIALCAPTGRAAKRLSESTGLNAKTIHRLLEFDHKQFGFKHNTHNPLSADLVVVDEASMVDVHLMNQLLKAIPTKASLLLIGDIDQLPSVGPGNVLADIIQAGTIPVVRLTEIFRQAATSQIIVNAHRINQGYMPVTSQSQDNALKDFYTVFADTPDAIHDKLMHLVIQRIPARFGFHPVHDIQVLTPMNRSGLGAQSLNGRLQAALNGDATVSVNRFGSRFSPNDKIIQRVNNYDKSVFNGDIGIIKAIDLEAGQMMADFDGRQVNYDLDELDEIGLAYATTIHKSQGSEYKAVVIPLAMQHYTLLERNLLYTAVTRGKQLVIIVAQKKALAMAIKNGRARERLTNLSQRLV